MPRELTGLAGAIHKSIKDREGAKRNRFRITFQLPKVFGGGKIETVEAGDRSLERVSPLAIEIYRFNRKREKLLQEANCPFPSPVAIKTFEEGVPASRMIY